MPQSFAMWQKKSVEQSLAKREKWLSEKGGSGNILITKTI